MKKKKKNTTTRSNDVLLVLYVMCIIQKQSFGREKQYPTITCFYRKIKNEI